MLLTKNSQSFIEGSFDQALPDMQLTLLQNANVRF